VLSFVAPDRFTRQTLEPMAEMMTVEGNTITLKRSGRSRQMAMDAVPEVAALIAAIRGTSRVTRRRWKNTSRCASKATWRAGC
jgi:hypothetical protein